MARAAGVVRHPGANPHATLTKIRGSLDDRRVHGSHFGQFWTENDSLRSENNSHGIETTKHNRKTERRAPMTIFKARVCEILARILDFAASSTEAEG